MSLDDEKYILLTTFRRNGAPVATPVWLAPLPGGTYGFYTSSGSGKAKRLAHTDRVTVQACDARGRVRPEAPVLQATAKLVSGPELAAIREGIVAKYGFAARIAKVAAQTMLALRGKRMPYADRGVVITLAADAGTVTH